MALTPTFEHAVVDTLREHGLTLGTAESCTGGQIASRITDVAGCSDVFIGGIVAYANDVKVNVLGVSPETLKNYGAVSEETAREMALARQGGSAARSDLRPRVLPVLAEALPQSLVGACLCGLRYNGGVTVTGSCFRGTREHIRRLASNRALKWRSKPSGSLLSLPEPMWLPAFLPRCVIDSRFAVYNSLPAQRVSRYNRGNSQIPTDTRCGRVPSRLQTEICSEQQIFMITSVASACRFSRDASTKV